METQSKLKSAFDIVYKLAELLTAIFFILLCLSVTVQVIARYFFNLAFGWGEELPIFLFLWVSFLAAAIAYRDGSHLSVDFIVALFPKKVRFAIYYINLVLSLGFVLTVGYYESLMTLAARQQHLCGHEGFQSKLLCGHTGVMHPVRIVYHRKDNDQKPEAPRGWGRPNTEPGKSLKKRTHSDRQPD